MFRTGTQQLEIVKLYAIMLVAVAVPDNPQHLNGNSYTAVIYLGVILRKINSGHVFLTVHPFKYNAENYTKYL